MRWTCIGDRLTKMPQINTRPDEAAIDRIVVRYIQSYAQCKREIEILEAGCGRRWPYNLSGLHYVMTGVDINAEALSIRQKEKRDLHHVVLGDLQTVHFDRHRFDVIYSAFVLEHVSQARRVLLNFLEWLKPGGLLILKFPDRDSVYGFMTRMTPFWFHILYKRHLMGNRSAGKPGFGPFPTVHEKIIARQSFHTFVRQTNLVMLEEYGFGTLSGIQGLFAKVCSRLSFGRLTAEYYNLLYILQAQPASTAALSEAPRGSTRQAAEGESEDFGGLPEGEVRASHLSVAGRA